jgi:hypothetical protein
MEGEKMDEDYLIKFTDQAGTEHCVPFSKQDGGNRKADTLLKALQEIGLTAEKYLLDKSKR